MLNRFSKYLLLPFVLGLFSSPSVAQPRFEFETKTISTAGVNCATATNCAVFGVGGMPSLGVYLNVGTSGTFNFEATIDGTTWFAVNDDVNGASNAIADGAYFFSNPGYAYIRLRASAINGSATINAFQGFAGLRSTATLSGGGDASAANQTTMITSLQLLDNASATIGTTDLFRVGIFDGANNQITTFGGGTQYQTGAAQATPTGTVALGFDGANVRALVTDLSGNLQVEFPTAQSVNVGTFGGQTPAYGSGNTGATVLRVDPADDDPNLSRILTSTTTIAPSTQAGTTTGFVAGGIYNATPPTFADGQKGGIQLSAAGRLLADVADGGGSITVDATNLDVQIGGSDSLTIGTMPADATELPAAAALADNMANPTTPLIGSANMCWDGATWDRCPISDGGSGTISTNTSRVTIATDDPVNDALVKVDAAIGVEDVAETAGGNLLMAGSVRRDAAASSAGASGDNATLNTDANGRLWTRIDDPCSTAKTVFVVNISSAATTEVVGTASGASTYVYICSINLVTAAANNVALVEDDTDACASPTAGMAGGTTSGAGWNFAANGGLTLGNGTGTVMKSAGANVYVCLITSAATQLSGTITYVLAP